MPGRTVPLANGQYYHVYNRGVAGEATYIDSRDYTHALDLIRYYRYREIPMSYSHFCDLRADIQAELLDRLRIGHSLYVEILAFCLMPNHFHFLIRQEVDDVIMKFMTLFSNSYSHFYNKRHKRYGPLFQGRFKSVLVEDDVQLLHLSRYIHINSYTSFLINEIADVFNYPYSSLREYYNKADITNPDLILDLGGGRAAYREFIVDRLSYQRELHLIKNSILD